MKKIISNRKLTLVMVLCAIMVCAVTAYALTSVRLASGTIPFSEAFNGPADVAMSQITMQPGDTIAWHYHPGRAYAIVKSGTVTEDTGCGGSEVFTAGQAFEEPFPRVHQARNTGTVPAELFVTVIVPSGQPTRVDTGGPFCGPLIDDAEFFVRQHYADFFNRQPDAGGLAYWTNQITQCGSDARCIHERRIGVSGAFFVELEFQETGYFVDRLYQASFGHQPTFAQFNADRAQVTVGPNLEPSKQALAAAWVERTAFRAAYPLTMSPDEFVNKLFDTANLRPYTTERQQLATDMRNGKSRAQVLLEVIEIAEFKSREYNPAVVLMQYFGYLRRDIDQDGYDFWLDVLNNREPNNYRGMICAFITSSEYQLRFGSVVTRSNADCSQ